MTAAAMLRRDRGRKRARAIDAEIGRDDDARRTPAV
jgi:hypothetical protein